MRPRSCLPCLLLTACLSHADAPDAAQEPFVSEASSSENVEPAEASGDRALYHSAKRVVNIVAHEDDDLGMVGLAQNLREQGSVVTVYLTAGDAGFDCQSYVASRETGILRAYEVAAGVAEGAPGFAWREDDIEVDGRSLRRVQTENGRVTLLFVGLPNSPFFSGLSILDLWQTPGLALSTIPDTRRERVDRYQREDLIRMLTALLEQLTPEHLNTLDSSRVWSADLPFDHPDHVGSALFALAAQQRTTAAAPPSLRLQRGYNAALEARNVSTAEADSRRAIFNTYAAHDPVICSTGVTDVCRGDPAPNIQVCDDLVTTYESLNHVSYTSVPIQNVGGTLRGPGARCLGGEALAGSQPGLTDCDPAAPGQHWDLVRGDLLRLRGSQLCASASFAPAERGAAVTLRPCDASASSQRFWLSTDGKLRAPDASCLQADGDSLSVQECSAESSQLNWALQVSSPVSTVESEGAAESELSVRQAAHEAFGLADVTGDHRPDLCERRASGIWCAEGNADKPIGFGPFRPWSVDFADAGGWDRPTYGTSVQLVDFDHDGAADVCGRAADGVYCARSNRAGCSWGSAFLPASKVSAGDSFSDAAGFGALDRSGSLRFGDLLGDGYPDLCARSEQGVVCAMNEGLGMLATPAPAAGGELADAGWARESTGSTLQLADLDGDGWLDVCGRNANGLRCALGDGSGHFIEAHQWSDTGDFSDGEGWGENQSYYGSIRLVDIDADGHADACARSADGVVCGISTGTAFGPARPLLTADPLRDSEGWLPPRYGASLRFVDLDGDEHADVCARGPLPGGSTGLRCAYGTTAL
jgi:hypothetical protein